MKIIKILIHIAAIIGLVLLFGNLKNWFIADRLAFANKIKAERECSVLHPGAKKFLKDFYISHEKKIQGNEKIIVIPGQSLGGKILSGGIFLKDKNNIKVNLQVSYLELNNWSERSTSWEWAAWFVLLFSICVGIFIFIKEDLINTNINNKQNKNI